MTWHDLRNDVEHLLTPAQLEVLDLEAQGLSQREIGYKLDLSKSAVVDRIDNAQRRLRRHGIHRTPSGIYYLEETA